MAEEAVRTRNKAKTRRRLLAAACELFYGDGICATGVGAVAEGAGVTKMTLYAHFSSKDDLVAAYLEDNDRRWREFLEERLSGYEDSRDRAVRGEDLDHVGRGDTVRDRGHGTDALWLRHRILVGGISHGRAFREPFLRVARRDSAGVVDLVRPRADGGGEPRRGLRFLRAPRWH